jgi:monoamine oxidase
MCDVIIVGAGFVGLIGAQRLKEQGFRITILEDRDRVVGRVWTHHVDDYTYVDFSGQCLEPTQDFAYDLFREALCAQRALFE